MPANLISATGDWGIDANELNIGIIIESIDETTRNEKSYQRDEQGFRTGRADYDESIEVKIGGKLTASSPFTTKLGANIVLANTITANSLQTNSAGLTVVDEVKRTGANEDWKSVEVDIEVLPFFS